MAGIVSWQFRRLSESKIDDFGNLLKKILTM